MNLFLQQVFCYEVFVLDDNVLVFAKFMILRLLNRTATINMI